MIASPVPFFFAIFINNSILDGGQMKIVGGQTWTNNGQTNAVEFCQKFEFGSAIFTDLNYRHGFFDPGSTTPKTVSSQNAAFYARHCAHASESCNVRQITVIALTRAPVSSVRAGMPEICLCHCYTRT